MSYFAVVAGVVEAFTPETGRLVPIQDAQYYIAGLEATLSESDGRPLFLWEDGDSGTSTNIVCEAEDKIQAGARPEDTVVGRLIRHCFASGCGLRIWWAGNRPDSHQRVEKVSTEAEALNVLKSQSLAGKDIAVLMLSR